LPKTVDIKGMKKVRFIRLATPHTSTEPRSRRSAPSSGTFDDAFPATPGLPTPTPRPSADLTGRGLGSWRSNSGATACPFGIPPGWRPIDPADLPDSPLEQDADVADGERFPTTLDDLTSMLLTPGQDLQQTSAPSRIRRAARRLVLLEPRLGGRCGTASTSTVPSTRDPATAVTAGRC
jgi:hypothetical protein